MLATIPPERFAEYGIVRIPVSGLRALKLTVVNAPVSEIKGHVVIPELNADDYKKDKARFTRLKLELARIASANIVQPPSISEESGETRDQGEKEK